MRPTRFYLLWDEGDADTTVAVTQDVIFRWSRSEGDLLEAHGRAHQVSREKKGVTVCIYERLNVEDATPAGDPPGLIWDWTEEFVEDVTA